MTFTIGEAIEAATEYIDIHGDGTWMEYLARNASTEAMVRVGTDWLNYKHET